jgi:KUP system potassium uptake protein
MSAIEGLEIYNPHTPVVPITIGILIAIFVVQQFGTSFIGKFFGPVMVVWFLVIRRSGSMHLSENFEILRSFNPYYAYKLIVNSPSAIVI